MSIPGNRERERTDRPPDRPLSTADLAAAAARHAEDDERHMDEDETLSNERDMDVSDERDADVPTSSPRASKTRGPETRPSEALEPLFTPDLTETYRQRWTAIQTGFVDDPRQAVRNGDELVAQIMTNLANTFADERQRVEAQLDQTGEGTTENLRIALRRYRSFFERLLAL